MKMAINKVAQPDSFAFSAENLEKAKAEIAKYPQGRAISAVMPLMDLAQRQHDGWLPRAAMDYIADYLNIPAIRVYEVANFYTMYNLAPVGRYHVQICTNISCFVRGSDAIVAACQDELGIGFGETTEDGMFTLSDVECLGACVNAPMSQINDDYYEDLTPENARRVLKDLKDGKTPPAGPQGARRGCQPAGGLTTLLDQADLAAAAGGDA